MRRTTLLSGLAVATIFSLTGCGNSHSTSSTAPVNASNQSSPQSTNTQTNVTSNNTTSSTTSNTSVTSSTPSTGQSVATNTSNASSTSGSTADNSSSPTPATTSTSTNSTGGTVPASTPAVNSNAAGHSKFAATIKQLLANPKNGPVDCSALVQYVYAQSGYKLPRTVKEQATVGTKISSKNQLKYGDVVFFDLSAKPNVSTFDGIYVGNGQFVAKTTHGIMSVNLNSNYWNSKFLFGQQILN